MSPSSSAAPVDDPRAPPDGTRLTCSLDVLHGAGVPVTVLVLAGELDISTQGLAATALGDALERAPGPLVVDLGALTFCSASGLGLFGRPAASGGGPAYVVAGLSARCVAPPTCCGRPASHSGTRTPRPRSGHWSPHRPHRPSRAPPIGHRRDDDASTRTPVRRTR